MAIKITDDCINCGACEPECPNNAIYEPDTIWKMSEGTSLNGDMHTPFGLKYPAEQENDPLSDDFFFIVTDKCTECIGFHDEPQCAAVCPVDCCVPDENNEETEKELLEKKNHLHIES